MSLSSDGYTAICNARGARMKTHEFDVLIVGAGLSGIGAACHLARKQPRQRVAILERRDDLGGTWDLFRYPGLRSDSDMTTFGYGFKPWRQQRVLADGAAIKGYIREAADEYGVHDNIRYQRKVTSASWCSEDAKWTVRVITGDGAEETYRTAHLIAATGYYNYDQGYAPRFRGQDAFDGEMVHPQFWPDKLDVAGKTIIVIGSGATAITLVPSLIQRGAHVTMLQRTPTYVLSVPAVDPLWAALSKMLPDKAVYAATRARNVALQRAIYVAARQRPKAVRRLLRMQAHRALGGKVDVKHFLPDYDPWDQRLCVVPDGDLFRVLRQGKADVVTFDKTGITVSSGEHLDADIVVSATGLQLQMFGGADLVVDGQPVNIAERMVYKGMMLQGIPNMMMVSGYTNASWTLKADIVCEHYCRILRYMRRKGHDMVVPRANGVTPRAETVMGSLESGYVKRAADVLPRQGSAPPWQLMNNYMADAALLRLGRVRHRDLTFRKAKAAPVATSAVARQQAA